MKKRLAASALAASLVLMGGCGGRSANVSPPMAGGTVPGQSFSWGASLLQGAKYIAPVTSGGLNVMVLVRQQNADGLAAYAQEVSDPSSGLYRQFLTPQEIADRFGATQQDYDAAASYFAKYGLSVAGWPQRLGLAVAGPIGGMEAAFGTKFALYQRSGKQFIGPVGSPHFATAVPVTAVQNLVALNLRHTDVIASPARAGENENLGYSPQVVRAAFDFNNAYKAGYTGAGITVGIIGTGPIESGDLPALAGMYHLTHYAPVALATVTPSGVAAGLGLAGIATATPAPPGTPAPNPYELPDSGAFASPPPPTAPCSGVLPACNPEDLEAQLDTQQIATLAYGANVLFYLAYNTSDCGQVSFPNLCPTKGSNAGAPQIGIVEADAEVDQAIADDQVDAVSISYGIGEPEQLGAAPGQYEALQFKELAIEGIAVFVSSGDAGASECSNASEICPSYPASDPSVTAVGGVTAPLNSYGQLTGPMVGWGTNTALGTGASGGGPSLAFAAPTWQQTILGATKRETPDVSLIGDPNTGVTVFTQSAFPNSVGTSTLPGYGPESVGGTSVAAPEMAAMWALVLDACKNTLACDTGAGPYPWRLGNAAPLLYGIYAQRNTGGAAPVAQPYQNVFYDIVYGSSAMTTGGVPNYGFAAGPGYDEVTGIGVPYAGHLIDAIVNPTPTVP